MRSLAYTKTDHTPEEIALLQDYCIEDCRMTMRLFKAMRPRIDLLRAPIRGAFMMEIERMRWHGIPIDMPTYRQTERCAPDVAANMRAELNRKLGAEVYYQNVFKRRTMLAVMRRNGIPIPIDPKTGKVQLRHQADQEHDRDLSAAEGILRRQADDRCGEEPEAGNRHRRSQPVLAQSVRNQDGAQQSEHQPLRSRTAAHDAVVHQAAAGHGARAGRLRRGGGRHRRRPVGRSGVAGGLSEAAIRTGSLPPPRSAFSSRPSSSARSTRPRCWAASTAWASRRWPAISEYPRRRRSGSSTR